MRRIILGLVSVLLLSWAVTACSESTTEEPATETPDSGDAASQTEAGEAPSFPDPEAETAQEVEGVVRAWVGDRAGDDGVYDIPERAGNDLSGTIASFHTVNQTDEETYAVCVDFEDGEDTYDVDFILDRMDELLVIADHYLHKVNGEAIE